VLVLHRLRFAQEIRQPDGLTLPKSDTKAEEMKMASTLINQLTKPFKPEQFKDEFSEKLLKVIEAKAKGKGPAVKQMKVVHSPATQDLMQQLVNSLKPARKKAS
jgi:DNA end-binding protein Ku